jgi:hypothetical protein
MIAWPACRLRVHPLKTQLGWIELCNENVDESNRVIRSYVVFQAAGKEGVLRAFLGLHETIH